MWLVNGKLLVCERGEVGGLTFHVQHAIGQYTMVAQQKAKIIDGTIRPRSNEPPMTSMTVQAQNSIWYRQNTISGIKAEPGDGATMTFFMPKFARSPMKAFAVREYASEYPQNIHWKQTLRAYQHMFVCGFLR